MDPSTVELAVEDLQNVDGVSVTRSDLGVASAPNGYVFTITFDGPVLNNGNMQELSVSTGCTGCSGAM